MTVRNVVSGAFVLAGLVLVALAFVNGLSVLYVFGGAVLVIALLVLVRSFGSTRGRRWAWSSVALVVLAALIVTPMQFNALRNPVIEYAPDDDGRWLSDGDGGGYVVTTRTIERLDASGEVDWEQSALDATWATPDGVITADSDGVKFVTTSGEVAWKRTALGLDAPADARLVPVAWSDGVTTISACTSSFDDLSWPRCRYVGVDAAGEESYAIEGTSRTTVYAGGSFYFRNFGDFGAGGVLPRYFALASSEEVEVDAPDLIVADASDAQTVATVPASGGDTAPPAFVGDRVLTGSMSGDVCTMSAVPIADDPGWSAEVPCLEYSDDTGTLLSRPSFETGLLDGHILWWRTDSDWQMTGGKLDAIGIDLDTGETVPAGEVLWGSLKKADAAKVALASNGLLVEARDGALTVRDPFSDTTSWTAPLQGKFHSAEASSGVLAVVTTTTRPRLFASEEDFDVTVYALDDGRVLGQQRFDPDHATHVLALDDAALLVRDDDTSIRVGG
jgi:hypothetical protein